MATNLKAVQNVEVSENRQRLSMKLVIDDGRSLPVSFSLAELATFTENMIDLGSKFSQAKNDSERVTFAQKPATSPFLDALATGFAMSMSTDQTKVFLVARFHEMDVSFRIEPEEVRRLGNEFLQIADALDAPAARAH